MASTTLPGLDGSLVHGGAPSRRFCHCHRSRKAKLRILRSGIPKPPWHLGAQTIGQATRHFPRAGHDVGPSP